MSKILSLSEIAVVVGELHERNIKIVVAGGCFDVLHLGHIRFLRAAKTQGDVLLLLLESDAAIRRRKGPPRPIHTQAIRAEMLEALTAVDYILPLPDMTADRRYDELILQIKPAIIATTEGDPGREHKTRQAKLVRGEVVTVIKHMEEHSTTRILETHHS